MNNSTLPNNAGAESSVSKTFNPLAFFARTDRRFPGDTSRSISIFGCVQNLTNQIQGTGSTLQNLKMDDTDDFTFCQAGLRADDGQLDSHENIPNISRMTLEDNNLNGGSMYKIGSSPQYNNLQENERLKPSGSKISPSRNSNFKQLPESKLIESLTGKAPGGNARSLNQLQEQKTVIKKPAVRAKVPFEIGYSPMDWLKLTRTEPDLAGLKGQSNGRLISFDEVKQHKAEEGSIWTVLKGRVYNISPYLKFHPGGADMLMKAAGKDCTLLFNKYHAWVNDEFLLEKCLVGILESSS